jgi:hypothetical protein
MDLQMKLGLLLALTSLASSAAAVCQLGSRTLNTYFFSVQQPKAFKCSCLISRRKTTAMICDAQLQHPTVSLLALSQTTSSIFKSFCSKTYV